MKHFAALCNDNNISVATGHRLVSFYLTRYRSIYKTIFDMGCAPSHHLIALHFSLKRAKPFRHMVIEQMREIHQAYLQQQQEQTQRHRPPAWGDERRPFATGRVPIDHADAVDIAVAIGRRRP